MSVQSNLPTPASDEPKAADKPEKKVEVIVQPGRSVVANGKSHGPGTKLVLSAQDAKLLTDTGHAKSPGSAKSDDGDVAATIGPAIRDDTKK